MSDMQLKFNSDGKCTGIEFTDGTCVDALDILGASMQMDYHCSNSLIDDYEFTETDVMFAIRRPIDRWNEMTPNIMVFTPATFTSLVLAAGAAGEATGRAMVMMDFLKTRLADFLGKELGIRCEMK